MKKFILLTICLILTISINKSFAEIAFSIQGEEIPKTKILFFGFNQIDPDLRVDSFKIFERIRRNLKTTGLFEIIRNEGKIRPSGAEEIKLQKENPGIAETPPQEMVTVETIPDFKKYSKTGIGGIVIAQFSYDDLGNLEIKIRMWDVLDERQLFGKFYTASKDNYRKVSNLLSDEIFKSITGEKIGHFNSKILYVSESGRLKKRIKKINLIDFDGENHRTLSDGRELVLTPIFSKKADEIFYLRYFQNKPQIFSLNLNNLRVRKVGGFSGTTFSASTNPIDSNKILLSSIVNQNSDIYELNIETNSARRLTKSTAIDTTPSYSPDGKLIAFTSDRDSGQQIYIINSDISKITKVTNSPGSYSKPIFSPDGKLIAFTKMINGKFYIGTISIDGRSEKLLASGYLVEGAKFSPSGRYLIYTKKRKPFGKLSIPKLFITDTITGHEFQVKTPENEGASDPDWA